MATEETIDQCIHMIAVNWRRTNDASFYDQSFPSYWAAFKDIDDRVLLSAINNFIIECTESYQPPFGVIRQHVTKAIGIKKAKERKAISDCPDCETGFREVSFVCRNNAGRHAIKILKCACSCAAGTQRVNTLNLTTFENLMSKLEANDQIIQIWHTNREQKQLPNIALPAFNPLIQKQVEAAAERRKKKTGLGSALAERRRQLKNMRQ
jgi:hypothetical protein